MHAQCRKTICMLVYNYHPNKTGGAEAQCRLQAIELVRQGYRCVVVTARTQKKIPYRENDYGCKVIRIPVPQPMIDVAIRLKNSILFRNNHGKKNSSATTGKTKGGEQSGFISIAVQWLNVFFFIVGASLYFFLKRNSIYVIHTHVASWNAGFAGWIGNKLNIPVVCKAAFLPAFHPFGESIPFAALWQKWRPLISYIALLPEMADDLTSQGVPRDQIYVIPNGVCIPLDPAPVDSNNLVLYVGNLSQGSAHKGFDILISAWAKVLEKQPDAQLFIAGRGEKVPWVDMAKKLGCNGSISFLGHVSDIGHYYKQASVFVLPSRGEGISNDLLEAQSYGIPAVVSDIPGNREVVIDKKTGILVSVNDLSALADEMIKLLDNPCLRKNLGSAARDNINVNFSITAIVERLKSVYTTIAVNL